MAFIETKNLKKYFKTPKGMLHAVDEHDPQLYRTLPETKLWAWWGNPAAENPHWEE